jgi:hypothetical protein
MTNQCAKCGSIVGQDAKFCPHCGHVQSGVAADGVQKKTPRVSKMSYAVYGIVLIVLVAGIVNYVQDAFRTYHPVIEKQPVVAKPSGSMLGRIQSTMIVSRMEGPFIIVSLKDVQDKRIVRFVDPEGVQTIPILAYITMSGKLVTAMSVSENCRSRDFYLEGENIHCATCPSFWNASSLEAYACCQKYYPDPIESSVLGDEIRINKDLVRKWQARS